MGSNSKAYPTVDEIVATLKRSSLPTVVVEGSDDVIVLRQLEEESDVSVLPVGGKAAVLAVFDRRAELEQGPVLAFVADMHCWVFDGIPIEYQGEKLILSDGYSIENDIYRDGAFERMLKKEEIRRFNSELAVVIECFALMIARISRGEAAKIDFHPDAVLDDATFRTAFLKLSPGEVYPDELMNRILADTPKLLRGKTLVSTLMRQLSYKGRKPRHNHLALLEAAITRPGPLVSGMFDRILSNMKVTVVS